MQAAGIGARVRPLASLGEQELRSAQRALFVVSTFGDGEAPDSARGFERKLLGRELALDGLEYAVLGLGDRQYPQFCGFARRLHTWLSSQGASNLFTPVEVDSGDSYALRHWQQQLGQLTGHAPVDLWQAPAFANWTLSQRRLLNPEQRLRGLSYNCSRPAPAAGWPATWWKSCRATARGWWTTSSRAWGFPARPRCSSTAWRKA